MAGIYLHIPFCKSKCPYCNFFSVASLKTEEVFLSALYHEIGIRKEYIGNQAVSTIYFGGGSPSILSPVQISNILDKLLSVFKVEAGAEVSLEANPDDVTAQNLDEWKKAGINRLSIGMQSFEEADLKYLGRVHSGEQAERSVRLALEKGFQNMSVDFIYGMPTLTDKAFISNLEKAVSFGIPHISAYALTVEPKTAMEVMIRKNSIIGPDEEKTVSQFSLLMQYLGRVNYEHYEISNFCLPGMYSRHNSSYWNGEHYLGLGPSAHSFNGISRQWNPAGMNKYAGLIHSDRPHFETEILSLPQKYNEYVMTSLRTMWGTRLEYIRNSFGESRALYFKAQSIPYVHSCDLLENEGIYTLSDKGKLFADRVSSDLFIGND
ncbi:MAG: radical SAM family heme chaperone HemW [Bacteroidota bacterium]|jgi:putative oxygen-independent coproporphyrinogen III oxidase